MKKIYVFLLFVFLFGFVAMDKASGQCEYCQQPNLCYVLTFDFPDCPGIQAVICYTCAVTHLEAYFDIHLRNVCHGLESVAYDYARDWVLNNYATLCGSTPCNEEHARLTFTRPICGRVENVNGRLNIYKGEGNCYLQCIEVWDWCWCNCVPGECWDDECPNPHVKWDLVSFRIEGNGICSSVDYYNKEGIYDCVWIQWRECGK